MIIWTSLSNVEDVEGEDVSEGGEGEVMGIYVHVPRRRRKEAKRCSFINGSPLGSTSALLSTLETAARIPKARMEEAGILVEDWLGGRFVRCFLAHVVKIVSAPPVP